MIHTHFVPSFYGDIRVVAVNEKSCRIETEKLTPLEKQVLAKLEEKALKKGWTGSRFDIGNTPIKAPIDVVAKLVVKLLKPGRRLISAVTVSGGKLEELTEAKIDNPSPPAETLTPYHEKPEVLPSAKAVTVAAVTVAAPTRGCPEPDFVNAEIRARGVLETFLDEQQIADFRKYNQFISVGQTTGHRYMVTSRHARNELAKYRRSLYDLDENDPLCVHDWSVPAAEEVLALHVLLQLPGWEYYLMGLRD